MPEWDEYRIAIPKDGERADNVSELMEVHHVVHAPAARAILEHGSIRAGIVYDESRMKQTRNVVVWLSANQWTYGSIYGSVQFTFPWLPLIAGKRFYWVEAMRYGNPAYRILITDKDLSSLKFLTPYDPSVDRGPLRVRNGTWYWNSRDTSEFMVDRDLDLSECIDFKGVQHKRDGCRLYGPGCSERNNSHFITGGRMLAFLLASGNHAVDPALRILPEGLSRSLSPSVDQGASSIWFDLVVNGATRFEGKVRKPERSVPMVRGALALLGAGRPDEARGLVSLLEDETVFEAALTAIVNDHFGIDDWRLIP
ncbi:MULTISPECIES: hypothetical protein [unclassified Mesorhizobium]|uniref:hypothetical protein n=1 Tax=unclassified Mesorhizobium TaxID=325217 RepID=UPI00112ECF13|nr:MULTISPECIES: hypothetical protein [unclassified Mesorhizobium]MBZ9703253.1 hypothetical protein [Mesorhizobium sp. CO1-1-3]MBZ9947104.1 hypothetical protein [Mesorhizobium sp. BR1-1-11]TPJ06672.1 hypothetical protein FJ428_10685 [Mesorhizobium sp. B2-8-1]